jgi:hypothetical protein
LTTWTQSRGLVDVAGVTGLAHRGGLNQL